MDRRRRDRIELGRESKTEVTVTAPTRSPVVGRLVDISADGAGVALSREGGSSLPVGIRVELRLSGGRVLRPLTVPAVVRQRRDEKGEKGSRYYGLEFTDKRGFDESLIGQALYALFNRRRSSRVQPEAGQPLEARIEGGPVHASVQLFDISVDGLALRVTPEVEASFAEIDRVRVSFRLPGPVRELTLEGDIRYRWLEGGWIRYGVEFDPARSANLREQRAAISDYVHRRMQETLGLLLSIPA